jgi:hypothetical protein
MSEDIFREIIASYGVDMQLPNEFYLVSKVIYSREEFKVSMMAGIKSSTRMHFVLGLDDLCAMSISLVVDLGNKKIKYYLNRILNSKHECYEIPGESIRRVIKHLQGIINIPSGKNILCPQSMP